MRREGVPLSLAQPATLLATWFGCGFLPGAPGTWASLAALPFAWAIAWGGGARALLFAGAALFFLGWPAATAVARRSGLADPGFVVVDEVAGQWLTLAAAPLAPWAYAAGFLLFRLFDITKPGPAGWADRRVGGGLGIMLDDALAAGYAAAILLIGRWLLGQ